MTTTPTAPHRGRVALVTLGCVRNDVDSEEMAGRLAGAGWELVSDAEDADVAVVNTCGFITAAKKDSIDTVLEAADLKDSSARTAKVVAIGCMAERYGSELAEQLPEADAVLGFDSYADMSTHLSEVLAGRPPAAHVPRDRRTLLPVAPAARQRAAERVSLPGHGSRADARGPRAAAPARSLAITPLAQTPVPASGPPVVRQRLSQAPWAPLKLASGCDRRCTFCAIPSFRGSYLSRPPEEVLDEARWLAENGVSEVFLVSENSTSYGKDLGDLTALEQLLPRLSEVDGIEVVRVSYLQPAEVRPGLLEALLTTPGVAPYLDLSFQHASPAILRAMRRFGSTEAFVGLVEKARALDPSVGIRSNVIAGFPGETEADVDELERFLTAARLDVTGVFGYSDEDGTAAADLPDHLPEDVVAQRVERLTALADELGAQRAEDRVGEVLAVLVEEVEARDGGGSIVTGRAGQQGPEVDGATEITVAAGAALPRVGEVVAARITGSSGADLLAEPAAAGRR